MVGNASNLVPLTSERAREIGRKGAAASAASRREKRTMAEALKILLEMPNDKGKIADISKIKTVKDLKNLNLTLGDTILANLALRAVKSDFSFTLLRDQIGEKPLDAEAMKSSAIQSLAEALKGDGKEADDHTDEIPP